MAVVMVLTAVTVSSSISTPTTTTLWTTAEVAEAEAWDVVVYSVGGNGDSTRNGDGSRGWWGRRVINVPSREGGASAYCSE